MREEAHDPMTLNRWPVYLLCFALYLPHFASAQTIQSDADSAAVPAKTDYDMEQVEVTATRIARPVLRVPFAVDRLTADDIQRGEAGVTMEEALRSLPGVLVNNRNNASQGDRISLRGIGSRASFGVRGLKLVQDGVPLTTADGQSQLNAVDLTSIGQIEVIRGPSSALYGNAAGGVIQLTTETPPNTPLAAAARILFGSDGLQRWQGKLAGQWQRHRYLININGLKTDGYRDYSGARSTGINTVTSHRLSDRLRLGVVFNYYDAPYQFNPSSLAKAVADTAPASVRINVLRQGASKKLKQGQGGLTLDFRDDRNQAQVTLFGLGRTLYNPIPGAIIDLGRKAGGFRGVFTRTAQWGKTGLRLSVGTDIEIQADDRHEFENSGIPDSLVGKLKDEAIFAVVKRGASTLDQQENVLGIGGFIDLEANPFENLTLSAGGRFDRSRFTVTDRLLSDITNDSGRRAMGAFSPIVGVSYRPAPYLALYGNFSTAFQTPTTTELSNQPFKEGGFNASLQPERLVGFESGVKGRLGPYRLSWDIAFFDFRVKDMLIPFQINDPLSDEIYYRNAGQARNLGMEWNVAWSPNRYVATQVSYTGLRFEFRDFKVERTVAGNTSLVQLKGKRVPGVPPHHIFGGLRLTHPVGLSFETNIQWIAKYFANDFNGPPPGSTAAASTFINSAYSLVDLRFSFQKNVRFFGLEYFVGVNNLFDSRYNGSIVPNAVGDRFFEPAAGRTWFMGFGIPFHTGIRS